jgi:hypothetical protein
MMRWETRTNVQGLNIKQLMVIFILLSCLAILTMYPQPSNTGQATVFASQYEEYIVQPGDTLWSIAKAHRGRRDIRDVVWELQEVNQITPIIHPGQAIWVPIN